MSTDPNRHTISLPDHERVDWLSPKHYPVVGLRIRGSQREYLLDVHSISYNVGASSGCDVRIQDDGYISSIHCVLVRRGANLAVIDKSKNGTYINNALCERGFLRDGAHLLVGKTSLVAFSEQTRNRITPLEYLCGNDPEFAKVRTAALSVALTETHVLVVGEPGTGKRTLSQAIHQESRRASAPYVLIDCDALSSRQIIAEILGTDTSPGVLPNAQGGTLVIHAIEHLPPKLFSRLVRTLNGIAGEDIRVVATSTNRDVIASDDFRWFRDSAITIELPSLRERWRDIPQLVTLFLHEFRGSSGPKSIPSKMLAALCGYDWPGNVQELRETIRKSVSLAKDSQLAFELFGADASAMQELLQKAVRTSLLQHQSFRRAAEALGMPKSTFADLARRMGLGKHN